MNTMNEKTQTVGVMEAKTQFSRLMEMVQHGAVIVLTRRGKPVAKLGPLDGAPMHPVFGSAKGKIHLADDFDKPLDDMVEYRS